jgi:hypothetical protein
MVRGIRVESQGSVSRAQYRGKKEKHEQHPVSSDSNRQADGKEVRTVVCDNKRSRVCSAPSVSVKSAKSAALRRHKSVSPTVFPAHPPLGLTAR